MSTKREPGGIPTGGRWATESKAESDVNLDVTPRASRADILAHIDEGSTYGEHVDDSTPPGTYALTAKTLGLARTYLMKGAPGDDDAVVLGRTDLDSGITYTGGGTLGGGYNGKLKSFRDFHDSLVSANAHEG